MFLLMESDLDNFADDSTVTAVGHTIQELKCELEGEAKRVIEWIETDDMTANPEKFKAIVLAKKNKTLTLSK